MTEHLRINQLLPHLSFQYQCIPLARGLRAAGVCVLIVVELNNPIFAAFVNTHQLSP
jgi:hypothetical protein